MPIVVWNQDPFAAAAEWRPPLLEKWIAGKETRREKVGSRFTRIMSALFTHPGCWRLQIVTLATLAVLVRGFSLIILTTISPATSNAGQIGVLTN